MDLFLAALAGVVCGISGFVIASGGKPIDVGFGIGMSVFSVICALSVIRRG